MAQLEFKDISKQYPGTLALDHVSFTLESGKVHALVGKNGSGKSTLVNILAGATQATGGEILMDGNPVHCASPLEAQKLGIATVFQENSLVPGLSVAENIFIGRLPMNQYKKINWKETYQKAQALLDELGIQISAKESVMHLNVWQQQMVEIAKAMSCEAKVLQLDEPTAPLAQNEVETLFRLVRRMKEKGVTIIYISHKLHELWRIADTCTVLRDGKFIGSRPMQDLSHEALIHMMFGDVQIETIPEDLHCGSETVLEVRHLSDGRKFHDVSFSLHSGEVLGIAGMLGSGRTELLNCIFGKQQPAGGEIILRGKPLHHQTPETMNNLGVAMTQEDRKRHGLVLSASIANNLCYASTYRLKKGLSVDTKKEKQFVARQISALGIKIGSSEDMVSSLSGGNQQKVVIGNWLNTNPSIILMDEPSRGIDVNAKQQIFQIIWNEARHGVSTLVVSTELEELIEICHRIIVLRDGKIQAEIRPSETTIEQLYSLCMGEQA